MILHPGVLALLAGSAAVCLFTALGAAAALRVLRRWDYDSSSEEQLRLERQTYLISTLVQYALGLELASLVLFLYTVDDLHRLLVGAMCATGSLNANPVGWAALATKGLLLFLAGLWMVVNRLDQQAEDYPLTRLKSGLLLALTPLVAADAWLQLRYFLGLHPDVITSCCGSLFSDASGAYASTVGALPAGPAMAAFYGSGAVFLLLTVAGRRWAWARIALAAWSPAALAVSLAGVLSFVSVAVYELPTHHCPFDMLQRPYGYVGYPLYGSLAAAAFLGAACGVVEPLRRRPSLAAAVARAQGRWLTGAGAAMVAFLALASYPVFLGPYRVPLHSPASASAGAVGGPGGLLSCRAIEVHPALERRNTG